MLKQSLLPADTFVVVNRTVLCDQDRKILTMLYQPIIGQVAISLYFTLWSYLDQSEIISLEWTHHHLMTNMRLRLDGIKEARERLEGIGLIKTYFKKGDVNRFVYEMFSPLTAHEFLNNPVLNISLYNNVGTTEYDKIVSYFKLPRMNLSEYTDITCKFNEIFEPAKDLGIIDYIIIDSIDKIKKYEFESWYKTCVNASEGIWIGQGINDQFTLKVSVKTKEMKEDVKNNFCFVIKKGRPILVKYVSSYELDENDDIEEIEIL